MVGMRGKPQNQIKLPFLKCQSHRRPGGGETVYGYYRRGGRLVSLGDVSSPDFLSGYNKIHATFAREPTPGRDMPGSINSLILSFLGSPEWEKLAARTKADYQKFIKHVESEIGHLPPGGMPRSAGYEFRDAYARAHGHRQADYLVGVLTRIFNWAVQRGRLDQNPIQGIGKLYSPAKARGYPPWPEALLSKALAELPPHLCRAILLASSIGVRGGDLIRIKWSDYDGHSIRVVPNKSEGERENWIPAEARLKKMLDAAERQSIFILTTAAGRPWTATNLRHTLGRYLDKIGGKGYSLHGLRASRASTLFEAECTVSEVMAVLDHKTPAMALHYGRGARRRKLSAKAIEKSDLAKVESDAG